MIWKICHKNVRDKVEAGQKTPQNNCWVLYFLAYICPRVMELVEAQVTMLVTIGDALIS